MNRSAALLLAFLLAGSVGFAFAADPMTAANAPMKEWIDTGNSANKLLCATVGDIGGTGLFGCKGKETGIHSILKTFNLAVFSIAAMFVLWNILAGAMTSANDGEFLGKRNSSTWGPLRMVIGASMLVPAFGGFNLAQLIMVWATAVGVGIAGAGASSAITEMNLFNKIYAPPPNLITAAQVADMVKPKTACVAYWNATVKKWKEEGVADAAAVSQTWGFIAYETGDTKSNPMITLNYGGISGAADGGGYQGDDCGKVSFPLPYAAKKTDSGEALILQAIHNVMLTEIPKLAAVFVDTGNKVAMGEVTDEASAKVIVTTIEDAMSSFDQTIKLTATAAAEAANHLESKTSVAKGDWISLGFAHVKMAKAGASVTKGVASQPTSTPVRTPPPGSTVGSGHDALGNATEGSSGEGMSAWEQAKRIFRDTSDSIGKAWDRGFINTFVDEFHQTMKTRVGELGNEVAGIMQSIGADGPMLGLINLGLKISSWSAAILFGYFGTVLALAIALFLVPPAVGAAAGGPLGGLITVMGFVITAAVVPLMFFGIKLAAYLPFLMAIIWAGAILNWLVIVIEALFGAPLWAMVHLDMEGDGMNMQRTGHGYIFLLNLLFRPIMMVGALVFALLAMNAVFALFLGAVSASITGMADTSSDWWANLMLIIGAVWVTVAFAEQIISTSLSLIFQIPDKVFAWIGGNFGSNVGADMERGVGGQIGSMSGGAASAARESGSVGAKLGGDAIGRAAGRGERAHTKKRMAREEAAWKEDGAGNSVSSASTPKPRTPFKAPPGKGR